jgi:hypothetical protein
MASGEILGAGSRLAAPHLERFENRAVHDPHPFLAEFLVL